MNSIMIITIVIIALLTLTIFMLMWLADSSCLKIYKIEIAQGQHDIAIINKYLKYVSHDNIHGINFVGFILVLIMLMIILGTGIIYKIRGENLVFNNQTILVIKSGSMSGFYNETLAQEYQQYNYDSSLQFNIGDICVFTPVSENDELIEGDVYGYKYKNMIITHRLIKKHNATSYEFRGDNNFTSDGIIDRSRIMYHYTGHKISGLGAFILYAQSYFGVWSLLGIIGVFINYDIVEHQLLKIQKERLDAIENGDIVL